jgi:lysophospholipase L1-like esterase
VGLDFTGDQLAVVFGPAFDQNFFNLTIDGATELVAVPAGPGFRYAWPRALGPGRHRFELFKRSEAAKGHVAFRGVELAVGADAWAPAPAAYRLRMQFIGDSITAGACNEDGATDQWDTFRTHNYAQSWAHLTAMALGADDRAMAYSGMGVITGWEPVTAAEIWDRVYPQPGSRRADLSAWQPDVVGVNLGENDDSFTRANHQPFPLGFSAGYVALVRAIRAAWPHAQIVLLRGGMFGGAKSPELRAAWEAAVHELEAGDAKIAHFVFTHWSELHPRVSDDQAMAAELTAWLKQQPFLAPHLENTK